MHVLHCYRTYFPDPQGGGQEAIRQIALSTRARNCRSTVFTLSPNPSPNVVERPEGIVVRCRSWMAPASCDIGGVGAFEVFRDLVKSADVIHYHFPWPFADILHKVVVGASKPTVMTYHSDVVRQRFLGWVYQPLMSSMLAGMSAVVPTSAAYARTSSILSKHVIPSRLRVIPLGICEESYEAAAVGGREISIQSRFGVGHNQYFLSLGVLRYYKGLGTLIDAAAKVEFPIVVAGDGPLRQELEAASRRLPPNRIRFVGQVTDAEKMALMAGCRAFVLPSHLRSEAFGMVLVEAAMCGRPMISCEIGTGTSYVNAHLETGLVIHPADPVELADAMNRLAGDEEFASGCGLESRRRYEKLFSGPALGLAYSELYEEVCR